MKTTNEITTAQIQALKTEAGQAGDSKMVETCKLALDGDEAAIAQCAEVIAYAADRAANG
jgi:hypothetical protein